VKLSIAIQSNGAAGGLALRGPYKLTPKANQQGTGQKHLPQRSGPSLRTRTCPSGKWLLLAIHLPGAEEGMSAHQHHGGASIGWQSSVVTRTRVAITRTKIWFIEAQS
jgi:hypothetical protein